MSLSRDSGLTLSDCQLFIPESPVGSEDSTVNAATPNFDKSLTEKYKSINKSYVRVYSGWEDRLNGYSIQNGFRDEKHIGYPNPNFQRQDWLRAQLKRTPRTKLDEHDQRKERFDEKDDIYNGDYLRQNSMKDNVENCKEIVYNRDMRSDYDRSGQSESSTERVSIHESEQGSTSESTLSSERYDLKKIKSEVFSARESPVSQNGSYHSTNSDIYEYKKVKSEVYVTVNKETVRNGDRYELERLENNNIYGNRETVKEIYDSREKTDVYTFKQAESIDGFCDDADNNTRIWPDTPPPLPPRLRHLPPVHMNLEDRHKIAGRSRSLPPPPPYRPPPQPRAPITTRHLGYSRSVVDDESYV